MQLVHCMDIVVCQVPFTSSITCFQNIFPDAFLNQNVWKSTQQGGIGDPEIFRFAEFAILWFQFLDVFLDLILGLHFLLHLDLKPCAKVLFSWWLLNEFVFGSFDQNQFNFNRYFNPDFKKELLGFLRLLLFFVLLNLIIFRNM